ncbi:hypothetical protein Bbelb_041360 [Branchiostoma belcheri]|nr:hypothetical protein Bbelb_041360 [Branchiostoma belcheri]
MIDTEANDSKKTLSCETRLTCRTLRIRNSALPVPYIQGSRARSRLGLRKLASIFVRSGRTIGADISGCAAFATANSPTPSIKWARPLPQNSCPRLLMTSSS